MRPNIHIEDMTDLYLTLLKIPEGKLMEKFFNAGYENNTVSDLGKIVKESVVMM